MPFKLTTDEVAARDEIAGRIEEAREALSTAHEELVDAINAHAEKITELVESYNSALDDLRSWAGDITSENQSEWDEKSEKWQEGEAGEAATAWIEQFDVLTQYDDIEFEMPEVADIDFPDTEGDLGGITDDVKEM